MGKIIWKDKHWVRFFIFIGSFFMLLIVIKVIIAEFSSQNILLILIIILLNTIFLFGIFNLIRIRLTYIKREGIRIGNAPDDKYSSIRLKNKPIFIFWEEIQYIKIVRKEVLHKYIRWPIDFLVIKTKNGKRYECFISKPKEFIKIIKSLKKDYLFAKDSKYLNGIK